jgi:hypothetical protein
VQQRDNGLLRAHQDGLLSLVVSSFFGLDVVDFMKQKFNFPLARMLASDGVDSSWIGNSRRLFEVLQNSKSPLIFLQRPLRDIALMFSSELLTEESSLKPGISCRSTIAVCAESLQVCRGIIPEDTNRWQLFIELMGSTLSSGTGRRLSDVFATFADCTGVVKPGSLRRDYCPLDLFDVQAVRYEHRVYLTWKLPVCDAFVQLTLPFSGSLIHVARALRKINVQ